MKVSEINENQACRKCFKMINLRTIPKSFAVCSRLMSSSQVKPLVGVSVDNEGIATLQLQRAPVNSFSLELLQELHDSVLEVEKNKCKGLVLTSESPKVFSAGMDLNEFHKPDCQRLTLLKETMFDAITKIFGSDLITTVAINGYTAAGACFVALSCDYRVMTSGPASIGVNDTAVGIPPALWIYDLMSRVIGPKHTEYALTSSAMYSPERALKVGLIDEIAANKTDAVEKCKAFIRTYDQISPVIRATTKRAIRQEYLKNVEKNRKKYVTDYLKLVESPEFQKNIDQYIQNLKQKKAAKAT